LHTLCMRGHRLDALFLTEIYRGVKYCSSVLEIICLRFPARYIREFALFNVCSSTKNCPSARCASAANVVCRDVDVFGAKNVLLYHILYVLIVITIISICKYKYYPFLPHNDIIIANVLMYFSHLLMTIFTLHGIIIIIN
jgi:hypothetical protein